MKKILPLILVSVFLNSCGIFRVNSGVGYSKSKVEKVDFCELEKYDGELIKTKLEYTGVEEYWSANGFADCPLNNNVYLNFQDYYDSWRYLLIDGQLNRLHNKYWKKKAVMTVVGRFEMDTINGFGHLGTNKAQIQVKSVRINIKSK